MPRRAQKSRAPTTNGIDTYGISEAHIFRVPDFGRGELEESAQRSRDFRVQVSAAVFSAAFRLRAMIRCGLYLEPAKKADP
jgi:hypothetical protein